jgi:hypothetical protein
MYSAFHAAEARRAFPTESVRREGTYIPKTPTLIIACAAKKVHTVPILFTYLYRRDYDCAKVDKRRVFVNIVLTLMCFDAIIGTVGLDKLASL